MDQERITAAVKRLMRPTRDLRGEARPFADALAAVRRHPGLQDPQSAISRAYDESDATGRALHACLADATRKSAAPLPGDAAVSDPGATSTEAARPLDVSLVTKRVPGKFKPSMAESSSAALARERIAMFMAPPYSLDRSTAVEAAANMFLAETERAKKAATPAPASPDTLHDPGASRKPAPSAFDHVRSLADLNPYLRARRANAQGK